MAHNLSRHTDENGNKQRSFYSLRESAWHGLGQVVNAPVSDLEAMKLAGLHWKVEERGLRLDDLTPVPTHKCVVRSDTNAQLGVVAKGFTLVQNEDLFEWLRGLEGFANDVVIETAGALGKGETVWVMAKCPGLRMDIKGDEINGYMLLANGHGGNRRLQIQPTTVRVVCANTLAMATTADSGKNTLSTGFMLRHTKNIKEMMMQVQRAYAKTTENWAKTEEALRFLAGKPLTEVNTFRLFNEPFLTPEQIKEQEAGNESEQAAVIRANREAKLRDLLASKTNQMPGTKDTLFSALQAVTEYVEHDNPVRGKSDGEAKASRFESANFGGKGEKVKTNAYELAMELAGA